MKKKVLSSSSYNFYWIMSFGQCTNIVINITNDAF